MLKQQTRTQLDVRFPGTIDGFNEEFCRLLFLKLRAGWKNNEVGTERKERSDNIREIRPGWYSIAAHLNDQLKFMDADLRVYEGIEKLLAEADLFLKAIE